MRSTTLALAAVSALGLAVASLAGAAGGPWDLRLEGTLDAAKRAASVQSGSPAPLAADNFEVLGHANLGGGVPNGDVW